MNLQPTPSDNVNSGHYIKRYFEPSQSAGTYQPSQTDFIGSFYAVLRRWESETAFISDPEKIIAHPSFTALVENAQIVLPLIIEELKLNPSLLVWVLDESIADQPYSNDDIGDIVAMSEGWIAWAERNGQTL